MNVKDGYQYIKFKELMTGDEPLSAEKLQSGVDLVAKALMKVNEIMSVQHTIEMGVVALVVRANNCVVGLSKLRGKVELLLDLVDEDDISDAVFIDKSNLVLEEVEEKVGEYTELTAQIEKSPLAEN